MDAAILACCLVVSGVQHTGWASSDNFVVMAPDQETAEDVLLASEHWRSALSKQWLGETLADGDGKTVIHVSLSDNKDIGLTAPISNSRRKSHVLWLKTTREKASGCTLATM